MLYESSAVRVEVVDGIATLWLDFPGSPVNALTPPRLIEIERALGRIGTEPDIEILVFRSARPAGFCGGHDYSYLTDLKRDEDLTEFASTGQRVLNNISHLEIPTLAFVEGPCLGPGFELALACDYRLSVAGPDSWFGFPDAQFGLPPCWGGSSRLQSQFPRRSLPEILKGKLLTAREAHQEGMISLPFSSRRGKIELRSFLDRLQFAPVKRSRNWLQEFREFLQPDILIELQAEERIAFRKAMRDPQVCSGIQQVQNDICEARALGNPPLPGRVTIWGCERGFPQIALELAIRGNTVKIFTEHDANQNQWKSAIQSAMSEILQHGRFTPLEMDQARKRIELVVSTAPSHEGRLLIVGQMENLKCPEAFPEQLVVILMTSSSLAAEFSRNARLSRFVVGMQLDEQDNVTLIRNAETDQEVFSLARHWLRMLDFQLPSRVLDFPCTSNRLLPREANTAQVQLEDNDTAATPATAQP